MAKTDLLDKLDEIGKLASRSAYSRLVRSPFKLLFTFLHRKFYYPISRKGILRQARTFFDREMQILLPAGTDLYLLGAKTHPSEIRLAKYFLKNLKEGMVFFDIGAHFGYYSLLASALTGSKGKVISFEPSSDTFRIFTKNVADTANIESYNLAAGDENGLCIFYEFPLLQSEYNTMIPDLYQEESWFKVKRLRKVEVKCVRLDDFALENQLKPEIFKIDVEGAEFKVLKGMEKILEEKSPIVIIEFLSGNENKDEGQYLEAYHFLLSKGYGCYLINDRGELAPEEGQILDGKIPDSDNLVFAKPDKL